MSGPCFQRVESFTLTHEAGVRYHIQVGVPLTEQPEVGYPVVFVLDGAAGMAALQNLPAGEAGQALVVAISYDLPKAEALAARAFDYTPALVSGSVSPDPRVPSWRNGGAAAFLDWLDGVLRPEVDRRYGLDLSRQTLCGHSYGGLCVLYALCGHPSQYSAYVSASPSLWWQDGYLMKQTQAALLAGGVKRSAELFLLVGDQERWYPEAVGPDGTHASRQGGVPTWPAVRDMAEVLRNVPGLQVKWEVVPGGTHATLPAVAARLAWQVAGSLRRR